MSEPKQSAINQDTSQLELGSQKRMGPRFDNALRGLIDSQPAAIAEFVSGDRFTDAVAVFANTELPGTTLRVDTLIETGQRRFHIEFQHRANARKFEPRLVAYWSRLHRYDKPPLEQHAIVLDPKGGRLSGEYNHGGLSLSYQAHHLWDYPAEKILEHPSLYPLAVLGSAGNREQVLRLIIEKARSPDQFRVDPRGHTDQDKPFDLDNSMAERTVVPSEPFQTISIALTLASIHLQPATIESILERTNMTVLITDLPLGKELLRRGRKQGIEQGLERGLEQGREVVLALAEQRFGSLPDKTRLALGQSKLTLKELTKLIIGASSASELHALLVS